MIKRRGNRERGRRKEEERKMSAGEEEGGDMETKGMPPGLDR